MENTTPQQNIEKNEEWKLAWRIINDTDTSLFLTGNAGTGKTTFLHYLRTHTNKRLVVLAPTGIAAINARGVTIHSFFQLPFSPFIPGTNIGESQSHYRFSKEKLKIIRGADLIVIDEISMVRSDLLDAVDDALKRFRRNNKPFGGVQMLFIGDLQQLAPVVKDDEWSMLSQHYASPYFFHSNALMQTDYVTVELRKIFRQDDEKFISILNRIRANNVDEATLSELNKRYIPNFIPDPNDGYIRLTTHNAYAQSINDKELEALDNKAFTFVAETEGNYPEYSYPTERKLTLKLGAQVMFIKNDTSGNRQYYNGMIGEICAINNNGFSVKSKEDGTIIEVGRETWQNCRYKIDDNTNEIVEEVEGTFSQYPVKLAWAITIHKSQGLTFSHAIIDVHSSFAHGQTYVALSRCKSLNGLVLSAPVTPQAVISDNTVDCYTKNIGTRTPDDNDIACMHKGYLVHLIAELFDFTNLVIAYNNMTRVIDEHLYNAYPRLLKEYKVILQTINPNITGVATRFHMQYEKMMEESNGNINEVLQERIHKGAAYFLNAIQPIKEIYLKSDITTNNKQTKKQLDNAKDALYESLRLKINLLKFASTETFSSETYLQAKANILLDKETNTKKTKRTSQAAEKTKVPDGNLHPTLLNELSAWRTEKMREEGLPAYCILNQKAITGVANLVPTETHELIQIPGIGKAKADKYGVEILSITRRYKRENP